MAHWIGRIKDVIIHIRSLGQGRSPASLRILCVIQQSFQAEDLFKPLRVLHRKTDPCLTISQKCDENPIPTGPVSIQWKPETQIPAGTEEALRTVRERGLACFDPRNLRQCDAS